MNQYEINGDLNSTGRRKKTLCISQYSYPSQTQCPVLVCSIAFNSMNTLQDVNFRLLRMANFITKCWQRQMLNVKQGT